MAKPGETAVANPAVELDGVTVSFDGTTALDDVSLSIDDGEFFTLVGPSGCGKTTTLRAIAGFENPTAGSIRFDGESVRGVPPEDRDIGIVFQNYALFPTMTVAENVGYGLRFRDPPGGASRDERVADLLELVDMGEMGDRDPSELSGGQQQRVALARALAPRPEILLLDEPLSALDARLRERLRVTVRDIQQKLDITTVYVTHDQAEALAVSDRVAVVNDGHIEQVAPPETVYREPASRFVAEFVGINNLFDGEVSGVDPPRATVADRTIPLADAAHLDVGDAVTLAIRPENLSLWSDERADDTNETATLEATVENVEFLGDAYRIHCDWQDRSLVVKAEYRPESMANVQIEFDRSDIHRL